MMTEKPQKPKTFQERFWWASPTALIEIGEFGFEKKQEGAKAERERILAKFEKEFEGMPVYHRKEEIRRWLKAELEK